MRDLAIINDGRWYIVVEDVQPAYTIAEAMHILRRRKGFVLDKLETSSVFYGPASTRDRPVDHKALVRYLERKGWERKRAEVRSQAIELLRVQDFYQEDPDGQEATGNRTLLGY